MRSLRGAEARAALRSHRDRHRHGRLGQREDHRRPARRRPARLAAPRGRRLPPPANVAKMRAGVPLDDADRAPWLAALAREIAAARDAGRSLVLACSALRRAYRDTLTAGRRDDVLLVFLAGDRALLDEPACAPVATSCRRTCSTASWRRSSRRRRTSARSCSTCVHAGGAGRCGGGRGAAPARRWVRWCPRQESNLPAWFRKPLLYPLSYGGIAEWARDVRRPPRATGRRVPILRRLPPDGPPSPGPGACPLRRHHRRAERAAPRANRDLAEALRALPRRRVRVGSRRERATSAFIGFTTR